MNKSISVAVFASVLIVAGAVAAQGVLVDEAADKVIKKYEVASCDQLKALKAEPPSERERIALDLLKADPKARVAFVDKDRRTRAEQDVRMQHDPLSFEG